MSRAARRTLHYATLSDVVRDAERLVTDHVTVGNWSFGQILQHLAKTMDASLDGFGFQASWFARWLIAPLVKNSVLTKPLTPGFKLPASATSILPDEQISVDDGLRQLKAAVDRVSHETPGADHPFLGKLATEEWMQLHLRHAELHMSFALTGSAKSATV